MLRGLFYVLAIGCVITLNGCATNAAIAPMTYQQQPTKAPTNPSLVNNIAVEDVTGGHETNPLWTSQINNANFKQALEQSLQSAKLYNPTKAKYRLQAELIKLEQPFLGLDLTVNCQVHYSLREQHKNKLIYDKNISSTYTATVGDSFLAITRLKMANEGAARANIQKFIEDLYRLPK